MLGLTITKAGTGYRILGKTDSGRTVDLDYSKNKQAVDTLALKVDELEDADLKELQVAVEQKEQEIATAKEEVKEVKEELTAAKQEREEFKKKLENINGLFKKWESGLDLIAGETIMYQGDVYTVLVNHRTGGTSTPDYATDLYKPVQPVPGAAASPENAYK